MASIGSVESGAREDTSNMVGGEPYMPLKTETFTVVGGERVVVEEKGGVAREGSLNKNPVETNDYSPENVMLEEVEGDRDNPASKNLDA